MMEIKKRSTGKAIDKPVNKDDPDERHPDPDAPNEEEAMPNKEMPGKNKSDD